MIVSFSLGMTRAQVDVAVVVAVVARMALEVCSRFKLGGNDSTRSYTDKHEQSRYEQDVNCVRW